MKQNREYRTMEMRAVSRGDENDAYIVEGYASTFDPYVLMTIDGKDYSERIEPSAFEGADLSDVVFRVDHVGPVYARTSAKTVELWTDEHGLGTRIDLGKTQRSRDMFADIEAGNYPQMSFAFMVAAERYDKETRTRVIEKFAKVFDVSAVSFPANPNTELGIATRDYFNGVIEAEKAERLEREAAELKKLKTQVKAKALSIGGKNL